MQQYCFQKIKMKSPSLQIFSCIIFILVSNYSLAQNSTKMWYFGQRIGLNFNQSPPLKLTDGAVNGLEGTASIADENGELLFYTNGTTIVNKAHEVMQNGTGIFGDLSSTNNTVIAKLPGSDSIYYLFTVGAESQFNKGLCYSVINMSRQNGLGEVIAKNLQLNDNCFEKLAAVRHCNKKDIWITVKDWGNDIYSTYLLSASGINGLPVVSTVGSVIGGYHLNSIGTLKFSSDGKKLVALHAFENNFAELMDFDNSTGVITNAIRFRPSPLPGGQNTIGVYGAAFSPNNAVLYVSSRKAQINSNELVQLDISSNDPATIEASRLSLWNDDIRAAGALQAAPDGKIYYSRQSDTKLAVIHQPDILGAGCGFQDDYLNFSPQSTPLATGLPNFIASDLDSNYTAFDFERQTGDCNDLSVQFQMNRQTGMDSVRWYFGDGGESTLLNPTHTYLANGTYNVMLIVFKVDCGAPADTVYHAVSLGATALANFLPRDTSFCVMPATLNLGASISSTSYTWSTGAQSQAIAVSAPGIYWLDIEKNGCIFRDSVSIQLLPAITVDLGPDQPVCFSDPILLTANATNAVSYNWSDGSSQPTLQVNFPGTYHVTVKNAEGCADSDTLTTIWGDCPSYIPSAFSPNDDGINETFGVINGMNSAIFTMIIYNRYGQVVFKTNNSRDRWNGTFKGKKLPMGAYPWMITYKNRDGFIQTDKGQVMLIR
jgi:gliding motility-associated-like protein